MKFTEMMALATRTFGLPPESPHGPAHWISVYGIGMDLAKHNGADTAILKAFAIFHDMCRRDDGYDPFHGVMAATMVRTLDLGLTLDRFEKLCYAIEHHAEGKTSTDVTIGTCWDADRLDLPRVNVEINPNYLSTPEGKYWAHNTTMAGYEQWRNEMEWQHEEQV